jgi:predicted N-acetyltransferase YhbS
MTASPFTYRPEQPADHDEIETLHAEAFGPGRFARAAFRLREDVPHDPRLSFVALAGDAFVASVRLTPIRIGGRPALLLGPLAVKPPWKGREPYYGPLGFVRLAPNQITLPAPVDPDRVLVSGLTPGALDGLGGKAERVAEASGHA